MPTITGAVHMLKYLRADAAKGRFRGKLPKEGPPVRSARTKKKVKADRIAEKKRKAKANAAVGTDQAGASSLPTIPQMTAGGRIVFVPPQKPRKTPWIYDRDRPVTAKSKKQQQAPKPKGQRQDAKRKKKIRAAKARDLASPKWLIRRGLGIVQTPVNPLPIARATEDPKSKTNWQAFVEKQRRGR